MKVVLIARQGLEARHLASELFSRGLVSKIFFETGSLARKAKLKRMLKNNPIWTWWRLPLDLLALNKLNAESGALIAKNVSPSEVPHSIIEDINQDSFVSEMKSYSPDLIVIYGTAIAKRPIREIAKVGMINFHGALVPNYRNVYGDYWALARKDYSGIGTSLLWVDGGIDTGDIVVQRPLGVTSPLPLSELRLKILREGTQDLITILTDFMNGKPIPRHKVGKETGPHMACNTPTFFDILQYNVKP